MRSINRWLKGWDCNIDGHKFEARYNTSFPERDFKCNGIYPDELIEKIYVKDICVHCGKTIEM